MSPVNGCRRDQSVAQVDEKTTSAELVALRVAEDNPGNRALSDVRGLRAEAE
jgi:hypothetical protein